MSVSLSIPVSINYLGERVLLQRRPEGEPQVRAGEVPLQRHHHLAHPAPGRQGGHAVQQRPDRGRDTANLRVAPYTLLSTVYDTFAGATRGRQRVHHLPRRHDEGYLPVRSGDHHLPGQDGGHRADQRSEDRQDAAGGGAAAAQTQGPH